jgi:hypothetical protein
VHLAPRPEAHLPLGPTGLAGPQRSDLPGRAHPRPWGAGTLDPRRRAAPPSPARTSKPPRTQTPSRCGSPEAEAVGKEISPAHHERGEEGSPCWPKQRSAAEDTRPSGSPRNPEEQMRNAPATRAPSAQVLRRSSRARSEKDGGEKLRRRRLRRDPHRSWSGGRRTCYRPTRRTWRGAARRSADPGGGRPPTGGAGRGGSPCRPPSRPSVAQDAA